MQLGFLRPPTSLVPKRTFIHRTYQDIQAADMVKVMPSGTCESRSTTMYIHCKRHLEAVMCVKGSCEVELVEPMAAEGSGKVVEVKAGDVYALDGHESHHLRCGPDECHLICVFNPACTGEEKQGPDGSFELFE